MDGLIYNQHKIPKDKWRYGFRSSAATGCGWIATYNALCLMGHHEKPSTLVRYYERQVPLVNGNLGTFLFGPAIYFMRRGFHVRVTANRKKFNEAVKENDVGIVFYYWRSKLKFGAHFVTVRFCDGRYIGYNTFRNSNGPDDLGIDLEEFLRKRKNFGCLLTAIKEKKEK